MHAVLIFYERDKIQPKYPSSWKSKIYQIHIVKSKCVFKGTISDANEINTVTCKHQQLDMTCGRHEFIHVINVTYTGGLTILHAHVVIQLKDAGQSLQQKY